MTKEELERKVLGLEARITLLEQRGMPIGPVRMPSKEITGWTYVATCATLAKYHGQG
jgi:hypothetical protein